MTNSMADVRQEVSAGVASDNPTQLHSITSALWHLQKSAQQQTTSTTHNLSVDCPSTYCIAASLETVHKQTPMQHAQVEWGLHTLLLAY